jgi:hypothetical protein
MKTLNYAGFSLIDEDLVLSESIIEERDESYFNLAYCLTSNYFGGLIHEKSYQDHWLLVGLCSVIAE